MTAPPPVPIPTWDDLELLLAVHRCGSAQAAAESLGLDASTVRRRLRASEATMRIRLFDSREGRLTATRDAQRLLEVAQQMDNAAATLRRKVIEEGRELTGVVRVSTMEGFAVEYLAARLARFGLMHALLRVELVTATQPLSLIDHECDVAINMTRPEEGALRLRLIGEFDVGLYASRTYLETRGEPQSVDDLHSHDFVGYVQELQAVEETRWLGHWVEAPRLAFASSSLPAQLQAVAAGAGIAAMPVFMVRNHPELCRVVAAHPLATRKWWLVTRADDKPVRRIDVLCGYIGETMRADESLLRLRVQS